LTLTRSSAFAALANLGYISDIIIIIINYIPGCCHSYLELSAEDATLASTLTILKTPLKTYLYTLSFP